MDLCLITFWCNIIGAPPVPPSAAPAARGRLPLKRKANLISPAESVDPYLRIVICLCYIFPLSQITRATFFPLPFPLE